MSRSRLSAGTKLLLASKPSKTQDQEPFRPTKKFWEGNLEIDPQNALMCVDGPNFWRDWVAARTGLETQLLVEALGLEQSLSTPEAKKALIKDVERLESFLIVQAFAKFKHGLAIADVANEFLPKDVHARISSTDSPSLRTATCFAIFLHAPQRLQRILLLDRLHRTGFARMKLAPDMRRPKLKFEVFLTDSVVSGILRDYDQFRRDRRRSELREIIHRDDHVLAFIRRSTRPQAIIRDEEMLHGYDPETIALDFFDQAKCVNISSASDRESLDIANRIAHTYFGKECTYKNASRNVTGQQVKAFLEGLVAKPTALPIVEIAVRQSPLDSAPDLEIDHPANASIHAAIQQFGKAVGSLLADVGCIKHIKVLYQDKRVSLIVEPVKNAKDAYVIRYTDQRLNATERRKLEAMMEEIYAIPIVSTEKRGKGEATS